MNPRYQPRRYWLIAIVSLAVWASGFDAAASGCFPAPTGILGWWPGDGNATDIVSGTTGALQGGATASAPGVVGSAFGFDGTNAYVQIPDSPALRPTNLTVEAWVMFSGLDSAGNSLAGQQYIVFRQNSRSDFFEGFSLSKVRVAGGDVFSFLISSALGQVTEVQSATLVTTGVWYHLAGVRGSNFLQLYVNGQLERQTNAAFAQDYGNYPLFFGTTGESYWDHKLKGMLDEVSLYNRALSSNEVAAIYAAGPAGKCKAAGITTQPQSQVAVAGTNATFTVTAVGLGSLSYQWQFNGTNLGGATATSLTLNNVQPTNAGNYTVVVTNSLGVATSSVATLTVYVPPIFLVQPTNLAVVAGHSAAFTASVSGIPAPVLQWFFGGTVLAGQTLPTLTVANAQPTNAGSYYATASNAAGAVTSAVVILTVNVPPGITAQPQSLVVTNGDTASFGVTASGTTPLSYQWRKNSTPIAGATATSYNLASTTTNDTAGYDVVVTNVAGAVTSSVATLAVYVPPVFLVQPTNLAVVAGQDAVFTAGASGIPAPALQWFFGSKVLAGQTSPTLTLTKAQPTNAGSYYAVAASAAGSVTSAVAILTVNVPPGITAQPRSLVVTNGDAASFGVTASGTTPLTYQWRKNSTPIAGATTTSYSLVSTTTNDTAGYDVVVTNVAGAVTSAVATLAVYVPPVFLVQPTNLAVVAGHDATFSAIAGGIPSPGCQWFFGANPLPGETASTLLITNPQPFNAGDYYCVATNAAGTATSAVATLTVNLPPAITLQPLSRTNLAGAVATFSAGATGTSPLSYQWQLNGLPVVDDGRISGAASSVLDIAFVQPTDAGNYALIVSNPFGVVTSSVAALTVVVPPAINVQPASRTVQVGTNVTFGVVASGTMPLSYQWQLNGTNIAGATGMVLMLNNVQPGDAGGYSVVVTNLAGSLTSAVAVLTVLASPIITAQPQNRTNVAGTTATFTATAIGTAPLSFQWQFNGISLVNNGRISGVTSGTVSIGNVQSSDAGNYALVVTNTFGAVTSTAAVLTVLVPPAISTPPASQSVVIGGNAGFSVAATGTLPLAYQWQFNGQMIPGATSTNLVLSGVQPTNEGNYTVVVTNIVGSVTSGVATLAVLVPPTITASPASLTVVAGSQASFSVAATGTLPLSYQWQFNGAAIPAASSTNLVVSYAQPTNEGNYTVIVTNVAGSATSAVAVLTVLVPPAITISPNSVAVVAGGNASLSVAASGTLPLSYQWQFNGAMIPGATGTNFVFSSVQPTNGGDYTVVVTNTVGSVTSGVATLTVLVPPAIVTPPADVSVVAGSQASFSVTASGTLPLSYQWQFNGAMIPGATSTNLLLSQVQTTNQGGYTVVVTNEVGSATSAVAVLTVLVPPSITTPPTNLTVGVGGGAGFGVAASGTLPLSYQWQFNGEMIPDATSTNLVLTSVQPTNEGNYTVIVTNIVGSVTSAVAVLKVVVSPVITTSPDSLTVVAGSEASLSVMALGTVPLSYQWQFNGAPIPGATTTNLLLSQVQATNQGSYAVVVTNAAGSVTSAVAVLTVLVPPAFSASPASLSVIVGTNVSFTATASGTAPLTYQWLFNGTNLANGSQVSGSTGPTLSINNVQLSNAGGYSVVVTNGVGLVTSSVAALIVNLPAACMPAPAGLVGWWPGDGNANDLASTNNGTLQGGATATAVGLVNQAFGFDGTNGYVQIPDAPALRPTNLTIEAWVRFDSLDSPGLGGSPAGEQYLVFKQNTHAIAFEGFAVTKTRVATRDYFDFQVSSASGQSAEITSVTSISTGAWYHVAAVRGSNFMQLYVNGQLEMQTNVSFAQDYGNFPLYFGTSGQASWDHKLAGALDEVSLYNRALATNEIAAIYAARADGKCRGLTITSQPQPRTVSVGANVSFAVAASGSMPLFYQWLRNGVALADGSTISGTLSSVLSLANVAISDSANYQVAIANPITAVTSAVAVLEVDPALVVPTITNQPASQTVAAGATATFTVGASGSGPFVYQWFFNGASLANGGQFSNVTGQTLAINYVLPANSGGYSVVVTGAAGSVTSTVATLTVSYASGCLTPPAGLVGWWPGDGSAQDIVGTNNGSLQGNALANATGFDGQSFSFDGTNGYVQIPDSPVFHLTNLTVECWVRFDAYQTPGNTYYSNQQYMVFKQNSRSDEFEGFALTKDHDPQGDVFLWEVASAAGQLIRIDSISTVVTGVWTHVAGVRGSNFTQLYMNGRLEVQTNVNFPQDYGNFPLYFGTSGQSYYDRRLHGELDEVSLYNRALSADEIAALYATGAAGKCKGTNGVLIGMPPQSQVVVAGTNVLMTVGAVGLTPFSYQWQYNGAAIAGATGTNLTIPNVQPTNAGSYRVVVNNPAGSAISSTATLTVLVPPTLTLQPTNQTVLVGSTVSFNVAAGGTAPINYQWQLNGTNLDGALAQTLVLTNAQPAQAGGYTAHITNPGGTTNSAVALLTVLHYPLLQAAQFTTNGAFAFSLSGDAGRNYLIEVTTNLRDWTLLTTFTNANGQSQFIDSTSSNSVSRFYRARLVY